MNELLLANDTTKIRYLQFGFNFSLIVVFLYLLVQFIFTIQRDVAERIGEVSMGTSFLRQREYNCSLTTGYDKNRIRPRIFNLCNAL